MNMQILNRREMLRTVGLGASAVALGGCGGAGLLGSGGRRPNIVLVLVDDLGWMDTSCYGSRYYETPNIDRLASQGMRFTNGYAACAVCSPTRAAVMTGRYPARIGVTDWIRARFQGGDIPADGKNPSGYEGGKDRRLLCPRNALWMEHEEITLAEALKPAGYTSCHIGKWHLGPDDWYPEKQGFDYNYGGCDYGQPPSYFDPYGNERHNIDRIPTLEPRKEGEYLEDRLGDEASNFIRTHTDSPFFLYMANYAVHTPIQGRPDLVEKYKNKTPTNQKNPAYAAMVESVDGVVGKIMDALDETGQAGNTIVIFTSDNGGLLNVTSNAPLRSGKGFPYEGGIREPVIVRWPGVTEPGTLCDTPITSVDYFPTLCAAAGVRLPADRAIDGVNIKPLLTQSGTLGRDALFWHFPHYRGALGPYSIIRQGDWKLIKRYDENAFELYNLAEDESETRDLAGRMPQKVQELDVRLKTWLAGTHAKMPKENPEYDPAG